MKRERIASVLLAGGLGSRMRADGSTLDKPLRLLAGRPLIAHAMARMAGQVAAQVINANGDPARYAGFGLEIVADALPDHPGPLAGVLAGMRWAAARGYDDVVSVPTDTPFLPDDLVARLEAARAAAGVPLACAASGGWTHPVVGLWPVDLADALEAALRGGMRKIDRWTAQFGCVAAEFATDAGDPFLNLNTPEELAAAEAMLAGRQD